MTDREKREKLILLIGTTDYGDGRIVAEYWQASFIGIIADHLLANGVTVEEDGDVEQG